MTTEYNSKFEEEVKQAIQYLGYKPMKVFHPEGEETTPERQKQLEMLKRKHFAQWKLNKRKHNDECRILTEKLEMEYFNKIRGVYLYRIAEEETELILRFYKTEIPPHIVTPYERSQFFRTWWNLYYEKHRTEFMPKEYM